jgi:hypothetical protein
MKEDGLYDSIEDLCILLVVWSSSIREGKKINSTHTLNYPVKMASGPWLYDDFLA